MRVRSFLVLPLLALAGCAFPARDYTMVPDASVIQLREGAAGLEAHGPDCATLHTSPSSLGGARRAQVAFGCATYDNLAKSAARPADLATPRAYSGQAPDTAASAVERYRTEEVTPLRETSSTKKGS